MDEQRLAGAGARGNTDKRKAAEMVNASDERSAFSVLGMAEVDGDSIDAAIEQAGDRLVCIFFWGVDCFNCDIAKKAMAARPEPLLSLDLAWFHANVYEHPRLGQRFGLHGIPVFMFFHRGKKLGRATGWHGHAQFEAAVANARAKIRAAS